MRSGSGHLVLSDKRSWGFSFISSIGECERSVILVTTTVVQRISKLLYLRLWYFLAFVRSGYINLNNGQARNVGLEASTRSRTANSAANAYYLNSNDTNVNPSNANNRYYGFPLR